ncbi:Zn-dependent exopeptidase [Pseudovirgaria hyperparasitica]|uniref:Zn-dependent exopeptidase n=1 Tax=Pseudovirgaria hyperparasitica TaxID=470096 RepID=A0A6A6VW19_9PEZI|nr:Zn-dependent exopeptidase [Pseudovirgaria hyperparasitica]KAF2754355.1 Zn-dependent exopeptidase [Pseudovirgaria hyperparasitica]
MRLSGTAIICISTTAIACRHDWIHNPRAKKLQRLAKRQVEYPPVLSDAEQILVNSFDNNSISDWAYYYTHGDHLGGSHNKSMAQWTADRWNENGLNASLYEIPVYTTYPQHSSLAIRYTNSSVHNANLIEDVLVEDDTTSFPNRIPAFHAMSASGKVIAEYVYVGRGAQGDFNRLRELGIELEGKVAVAMYGGIYRGIKVKNAQDNGMAGAVLFTDSLDDGEITTKNGYAAYPIDGPARQPSSIQRGSVRFSSLYSGDPTTVGYASGPGAPRGDTTPYTPSIPSIPVSMIDAVKILGALNGHGFSGQKVNRSSYVGHLEDVEYFSGPAPGVTINITHFMKSSITPVWNVIGVINGTSQDEVVIVGNHRDAWVIGGAADPNSGSAILIEMSRAFGKLLAQGWKPKRTILLASWDAEEFGLQGSTEWVESHLPWLTSVSVSYLNIDIGVGGPRTGLSGTGDLQTIATETMKKILYPEGYGVGPTLYDSWRNYTEGYIPPLGSGSDYAAFWHNGISALDISSDAGPTDPVYHYHSNYDTFHWMVNFGDPGFHVHTAMGQFMSLLTYTIADSRILPYDLPNYENVLQDYYNELLETIADANVDLNTTPLRDAIGTFGEKAAQITSAGQTAQMLNDTAIIQVINSKYRDFQRGFVSQGGLPSRNTFRNVLSAPGLDNGYGAVVFPPITEGVESGDLAQAEEWIQKSANAILRAAEILDIDYGKVGS